MTHIDVIKYFAKYPLLTGVLKNFVSNNSTEEYTSLRAYFEAMPEHSLIADIQHYVIGEKEEALSKAISSLDGWFMLVENGGINVGALNQVRTRESQLSVQVTIACHWTAKTLDPMAEALTRDKGLQLIFALINMMKTEDREQCPVSRWLDSPFQIDPVEPYLLFQSIGWQLTLNRTYSSLL